MASALDKLLGTTPQGLDGISDENASMIRSLVATLSETSRYHSSDISCKEVGALLAPIIIWPALSAFPAVDIARIAALHPRAGSHFGSNTDGIFERAVTSITKALSDDASPLAVILTGARFCANVLSRESCESVALKTIAGCMSSEALVSLSSHDNKNVRLAVATLVANASRLVREADDPFACSLAACATSMLARGPGGDTPTVLMRALVCIGSLLALPGNSEWKSDVAMEKAVRTLSQGPDGDDVTRCAKDVLSFM